MLFTPTKFTTWYTVLHREFQNKKGRGSRSFLDCKHHLFYLFLPPWFYFVVIPDIFYVQLHETSWQELLYFEETSIHQILLGPPLNRFWIRRSWYAQTTGASIMILVMNLFYGWLQASLGYPLAVKDWWLNMPSSCNGYDHTSIFENYIFVQVTCNR
jgi:hypothetical protein